MKIILAVVVFLALRDVVSKSPKASLAEVETNAWWGSTLTLTKSQVQLSDIFFGQVKTEYLNLMPLN